RGEASPRPGSHRRGAQPLARRRSASPLLPPHAGRSARRARRSATTRAPRRHGARQAAAPHDQMTVRLYGALVALLLPSGFNDAFADELLSVYAEVDREARLPARRRAARL